MSNETFVEYRVVPVTRYQVTRFSKSLSPCRTGELTEGQGCCGSGEFDNEDTAYEVAYALARADHERLGWPLGDGRIQYPRHPRELMACVSGSRKLPPAKADPIVADAFATNTAGSSANG